MSEPLAYRLSDVPKVFPIGKTKLAALIKTGELESFRVGRLRGQGRTARLHEAPGRPAEEALTTAAPEKGRAPGVAAPDARMAPTAHNHAPRK
jgi:hypothetical protein